MESNRETFLNIRAEEMATLYDSTFTKKEAVATGKRMVDNVLESGNVNIMEFGANLARLNEVIGSAVLEFRKHIIDEQKQTVLGVKFSPVNGGNTVNYKEDEVWAELNKKLKAREELLKMAVKNNEEFTVDGVYVPIVSTTPRASSITIKF